MRRRRALVAAAAAGLAAGCDGFPKDANGTLGRARAGAPLRVGWTASPPWAVGEPAQGGGPSGIEPDLVRAFAASLGTTALWRPGSASRLVEALAGGALDLAVGDFPADHPWGSLVGTTRPYLEPEVTVGARPGAPAQRDWAGVEVGHDADRPDMAARIREAGAVPVPLEEGGPATAYVAAYAPELPALGLEPTGARLRTERRAIATAPAENALVLALDRFLHGRKAELERRLAGAAATR